MRTLLQDRVDYAIDDDSVLAEALALGRGGLATGPADGPDRACHLVNLGTCWDRRAEDGGGSAVVRRGCPARSRCRRPRLGVRGAPRLRHHYADALRLRWQHRHRLDDLDEAVSVLRDAVRADRVNSARTSDLIANLAQLSGSHHSVVGDSDGLDDALSGVADLAHADLGRSQRATVDAALTRLAVARYRHSGSTVDRWLLEGAPAVVPQDPVTAVADGSRPVWTIPARRRSFVGRGDLLVELASGARTSGGTMISVLVGMGGSGKTTAAIEYAHRHRADFDVAWWVPVEDPASIADHLAQLAQSLGLVTVAHSPEVGVARLMADLARRRRWLLVFDNLEDPNARDDHPVGSWR